MFIVVAINETNNAGWSELPVALFTDLGAAKACANSYASSVAEKIPGAFVERTEDGMQVDVCLPLVPLPYIRVFILEKEPDAHAYLV